METGIMDTKEVQLLTAQLTDINNDNSALINILTGYCKFYQERPSNGCLFDILTGLQQIKNHTKDIRKLLSQIEDNN